jgi:hypothetical protein
LTPNCFEPVVRAWVGESPDQEGHEGEVPQPARDLGDVIDTDVPFPGFKLAEI